MDSLLVQWTDIGQGLVAKIEIVARRPIERTVSISAQQEGKLIYYKNYCEQLGMPGRYADNGIWSGCRRGTFVCESRS